jgi:RND family efflux transporter MFP subunit
MNRSKTLKIGIATLLLLGGATFFYKKVYIPKSTYGVYYAGKGTTAVEVFGIGELDAKDIYPVGTATGGKILTVETDQGEHIKKDDVIATLDPVDLKKKLDTVKVSLKRAKIDLESAKKELTIAKEQNALTLSTYQKDLQVYKAKGISRLAYEKSKTAMLTSKTQVALAQSKVASMTIRLQEIENDIEGTQKRLEQLTIISPLDGYVIEKTVQPGQSVPPAFSLVKIVDPKTLWIKAWIDERISGKVKVGQKAKIVLRSREIFPYDGIVRRIAAVSDPVTQEREVDVGFEKIPEPFYINEQAEVSITVETFKGLYKVPLRYLETVKGKKGVWIREHGQAHFKVLSIVAEDGEFAGVAEGVDEKTEILIPDAKKKPFFEGSTISI